MKPRAYQFVSLRTEPRGNGKPLHVVTWTPEPNDRRRFTSSDLKEATAEADRLEKLFQHGFAQVTKLPRREMVALILLCEQLGEIKPHEIVKFYLEHHQNGAWKKQSVTVKEVGEAYEATRKTDDFSPRHQATVHFHVQKFIKALGDRDYAALTTDDYQNYLDKTVGGAGKTRQQHLITLRAMSRWARDVGANGAKFLPPGKTAPELVTWPKSTSNGEHGILTPEQFWRYLIATPTRLVTFTVLGQLAGIRAAERCRLLWQHWRAEDDGKIMLGTDVTKTEQRRLVDVSPCLALWLSAFKGEPAEPMVPMVQPHRYTAAIAKAAGLPRTQNAFRAGFCSYHLELYDSAHLTAKISGHSVDELQTSYLALAGVTKTTAQAILLGSTPAAVLAFAKAQNLPTPEWAVLFRKK